ncbi:hypothetical protein [Glutamicibacter sp. NPDC087583]|uniref:hypothetical protein n=1 Tax=Glutamicibacter sp. NPDC087583 TaxID=3363995 RepID=UPI0037F5649A
MGKESFEERSTRRPVETLELSPLMSVHDVLIGDQPDTAEVAAQVLCSPHPDNASTEPLAEYMLHALRLEQRLDELGVAA